MKVKIFTDGGSRGNPGHAAIGVVIQNENEKILKEYGKYIGETTNNQAEYRALLSALETAQEMGATEVHCFLDSELVVKQMRGEYKVRDKNLAPLFVKIWNLKTKLKKVTFIHIPRHKNSAADAWVNKALDAHIKSK